MTEPEPIAKATADSPDYHQANLQAEAVQLLTLANQLTNAVLFSAMANEFPDEPLQVVLDKLERLVGMLRQHLGGPTA